VSSPSARRASSGLVDIQDSAACLQGFKHEMSFTEAMMKKVGLEAM
jgi:hypothetical protein